MFRCLGMLILLSVLGAALYFGHGLLLGKMGEYLFRKDELKPADVIVVLAGEETERIEHGVKLFKEEWARKNRMIMSGGPAVGRRTSADLMKEYAEELGVPARSVLTQGKSRSTEQDALYTKELLLKHGYKSLILVTSPYHSKRASLIFRKILGPKFRIVSSPSEHSWFNFEGWWKRTRDRDMVLSEFSKFVRVWLFGVTGEQPDNEEGPVAPRRNAHLDPHFC